MPPRPSRTFVPSGPAPVVPSRAAGRGTRRPPCCGGGGRPGVLDTTQDRPALDQHPAGLAHPRRRLRRPRRRRRRAARGRRPTADRIRRPDLRRGGGRRRRPPPTGDAGARGSTTRRGRELRPDPPGALPVRLPGFDRRGDRGRPRGGDRRRPRRRRAPSSGHGSARGDARHEPRRGAEFHDAPAPRRPGRPGRGAGGRRATRPAGPWGVRAPEHARRAARDAERGHRRARPLASDRRPMAGRRAAPRGRRRGRGVRGPGPRLLPPRRRDAGLDGSAHGPAEPTLLRGGVRPVRPATPSAS